MKKLFILTVLILLFMKQGFAQQNVIAKFIVTDARANGQDVTPQYTSQNAYYVVYTLPKDTTIYLAGVMAKAQSQSFGPTYNMQSFTTPKTATDYETDHFNFSWSYANTYDTHKGTATVKLLKIGKPNGVAFELTIIPENLDVLECKGYMEGTLNLQTNK